MYIHIGYFEKFKGANTILVCGDEEGLQRLADHLRPLEDRSAQPVNIHALPFVHAHRCVTLTAFAVDKELGVRRTGSSACFEWHHSEEGWLESAEKIEVIAHGNRPGHNYLGETPAVDAVIVVSKGEYGDGWWERNG